MGMGRRFRDPGFGKKPIPDPGSRGLKPPDPGSTTLLLPMTLEYKNTIPQH
jgi:hypothetical protein